MEANDKRLNRNLLLGWSIIVGVLFVAYTGEVVKGVRSGSYLFYFMLCTALPALLCWWKFWRDPLSYRLRYLIVAGYFVMYIFVMLTGNTILVFTYILPMLSLLILYHQPKLILGTAIATLVLNLSLIVKQFAEHQINNANSRDVEIQIALLGLCFGECYIATRLYDRLHKDNTNYIDMLGEKNKQIQRLTLQTIETIANTIDAKDEYTKGHSSRVSEYAVEIATRMGMEPEVVDRIRYIALLHDIGKIGVPDSVLNKPGKLSDSEYELIKKHTTVGGEILKDVDMLPDLDIGAKYHHERYDGNGYPEGLKGEEIPLTARIICLADAYDAMTSNRVYRKHLTKEAVIAELKGCRGKQFDPVITDVFLDYLESEDSPLEELEVQDETQVNDSGKLLQQIVHDRNEQMVREAERDSLTRVYNRSTGERRISARLLEENGCLVLLNLDHMRSINRHYGFVIGDYCLQAVAEVLKEMDTDVIVSRFGGDEFMCFLPGITDQEQIVERMDDVMNEIRMRGQTDEKLSRLSVSAGITICDQNGMELSDYLMQADKALYHVKQKTKNGYYFYQQVVERSDNPDITRVDMEHLKTLMWDSDQDAHIVLFTIWPVNEASMRVEDRDEVMRLMECAIAKTLKDDRAVQNYSSVQKVIILSGDSRQVAGTTDSIMREFYKMYDKKDVELSYSFVNFDDITGLPGGE